MPIDREKQVARWKRNKQASRDRARQREQSLRRSLHPDFLRRVDKEREERAAAAYAGAQYWPESRYLSGERLSRAIGLAADVWRALIIHEAEWGEGTATTARIFDSLKASERTHGYTDGSLRKMIPKARERVLFLESHGEPWTKGHVHWPPFDRLQGQPD